MVGVRLQENEKYSDTYPGFIDRGGGSFRKPYFYEKVGKLANRYYTEVVCACGTRALAHASNVAKSEQNFCSLKCKRNAQTKPDGTLKLKRGSTGPILEKRANHPFAKKGFVAQHRLVVEQHLGRYLSENEVVHHINCVDTDNELGNLFVCTQSQHTRAHNSIMNCVRYLLENNIIYFDKDKGEYLIYGASVRLPEDRG